MTQVRKHFIGIERLNDQKPPDENYVAVPIEEPSNPAPAVGQNMSSEDKALSVAFKTRTEVVSINQLEEWEGVDAQEEKGTKKQM